MKRILFYTALFFGLMFALSFTTSDQRRELIWNRVMADGTPNTYAGWDANGDPAEIAGTTGLDGTMVANRVPFGLDANTLTTDADFTVNTTSGLFSWGGTPDPMYRLSTSVGVVTDYKAGSIVSNAAPFIIDMTAGFSLEGSTLTLNASGTDLTINAADDVILDPTDAIELNSNIVLAPTSSSSHLYAGTYTPTLTASLNISSTQSAVCHFTRVGNVVSVSGVVQATPTAGGNTDSTLSLSLPIASDFTLQGDAGGSAGAYNFNLSTAIVASSATDNVSFRFLSPGTTVINFAFHFMYLVK